MRLVPDLCFQTKLPETNPSCQFAPLVSRFVVMLRPGLVCVGGADGSDA